MFIIHTTINWISVSQSPSNHHRDEDNTVDIQKVNRMLGYLYFNILFIKIESVNNILTVLAH